MNSLSSTGSTQASSWAANRREAIEKAQKLRDDRKYGLANTGEMTLNTHNTKSKNAPVSSHSATTKSFRPGATSTMNNTQENYGYKKAMTSTFDYSSRPISNEEHQIASDSLRLLKSKMGRTNTQNMDQLDAFAEESGVNTKKYSRGQEANLKKDSYRQPDHSRREPLDEVPQSGNQNYRKVFKPSFDNDNGNQGQSNGFNKGKPSRAQASKQGSYLDERQLKTIPVVDHDEDTGFGSQNIPSRIPKTTAGQTKVSKGPSYEDQHFESKVSSQMGGNKLGAKRTRDEQPRYGDESPVNDYLPASKQQYQPRQQEKVYNPSNYSAQNNVKPPSREAMDNFRSKPAQKGPSQMASQKAYSHDEDFDYQRKSRQDPFADEEAPAESGELIECPEGCGRKFFENVLPKHAKICKKVFQSKRKEFNIAEHRMTEDQAKVIEKKPASKFNQTKTTAAAPSGNAKPLSKKAKWKQQSEMFRANLKQARGATLSKEEQMTVATSTDNLTQCDYCSRKFNEEAAKRHIPFCKNKTKMDSFKRAPTKGKFGK